MLLLPASWPGEVAANDDVKERGECCTPDLYSSGKPFLFQRLSFSSCVGTSRVQSTVDGTARWELPWWPVVVEEGSIHQRQVFSSSGGVFFEPFL